MAIERTDWCTSKKSEGPRGGTGVGGWMRNQSEHVYRGLQAVKGLLTGFRSDEWWCLVCWFPFCSVWGTCHQMQEFLFIRATENHGKSRKRMETVGEITENHGNGPPGPCNHRATKQIRSQNGDQNQNGNQKLSQNGHQKQNRNHRLSVDSTPQHHSCLLTGRGWSCLGSILGGQGCPFVHRAADTVAQTAKKGKTRRHQKECRF